MSDEKTPELKDVELKDLTKEKLAQQIQLAKRSANESRQKIADLQDQIQRDLGVAGFAEFLLRTYKIADAPKEDPKKPSLEVK